ncbi:MAG: hypothetical protein DWP97_11250 [Calditrichaeota bacterium]|nr:MAG: hypothetical protein DWP97_11250 [Calditrichota bacterium]
MPGIFGIIAKDRSKTDTLKSDFLEMGKILSHYSYYKMESYEGKGFIFGQTGIPYRNFTFIRHDTQSKRGMVFDGQMYGWRGEPLEKPAHLTAPVENIKFEKFDSLAQVPQLINGSFQTVLFDEENDYFCLATDRMGFRNWYIYEDDEVIAFAPEIKGFLALSSNKVEVDRGGMVNFFNYQFLANSRTLMKNAIRPYAAALFEVKNRKMSDLTPYYTYKYSNELDGDVDHYAKLFYEKGAELFERQIGNEPNFMMALSGGMDSRLCAHYCAESGRNINYYTHGYKKSVDVRLAHEVADVLGVSDNFYSIDMDEQNYPRLGNWTAWLVDGMTYMGCSYLNSVIEQYKEKPLEAEFLNSQFSGALNFAFGYDNSKHIIPIKDMPYEEILKRVAKIYGADYINDEYHSLFQPDVVGEMKERFYPDIEEILKFNLEAHDYFIGVMNKFTEDSKALRYMSSYDLYRYVYNWHFILIDDEIIEMHQQVPVRLNSDRIMYKRIFAKYLPDVAKVMYEKSGADLFSPPNEKYLAKKSKHTRMIYKIARLTNGMVNPYDKYNYVQLNQWYRKFPANRKYFESILLDKRTFARGYFNEAAMRTLLKKQAHGANYFGVISNLTSFELFNRYFVDREDPPVNPME